MPIEPSAAILAVLGIVIGGVLKGATGAGAPVVAVPMLAIAFDVPTAVTIFAIPNLLSNGWQAWLYRRHSLPWGFTAAFALAGLVGAGIGTIMLVSLSANLLRGIIAIAVFSYIGFRLLRPDWTISYPAGLRAAAPVGVAAGILQGAIGVSAPVSVTFLNAMRLEREVFIATIALFFVGMSVVQIPMMAGLGLMTTERVIMGFGALGLVLVTMPLGEMLGRRLPRSLFDRLILILLAVIALRLMMAAH